MLTRRKNALYDRSGGMVDHDHQLERKEEKGDLLNLLGVMFRIFLDST